MFLLPLALIVPAVLCAAVVAYGIDPYWAQYRWGVDLIMTSRRLQWPLVAATVVLVIGLLAMVIAGKRRVWWLIALLPVLALFVHRFATSPLNALAIVENPALVDGSATGAFLNDEDHVVGVVFEGNAYAYPYACLFITPVVIQQDYDQRMMIVWSAFANRALAFRIDREIKARELEIVSIPANALLLYNARVGQFINGVTGRDREGKPPAGVREALPVTKTTWARWRATHPQSRVMSPQRTSRRPLPTVAVLPRYPAPPAPGSAVLLPETPVILVGTDPPLVLRGEQVSRDPLNLKAGDVPLLVFRDKTTGAVRAFDRRVEDLTPRFSLNTNAKRAGVAFIDSDTRAGWNTSGAVVDGEKEWRGKRLTLVPVEENLYWGVMKHWYPDLQVWAPPR